MTIKAIEGAPFVAGGQEIDPQGNSESS